MTQRNAIETAEPNHTRTLPHRVTGRKPKTANNYRIIQGSYDSDTKTAIKKRVRVIKNRLAAKRSREQARSYVQQLESTLSALAARNEFLAQRLAAVEAQNETLKRGISCRPISSVCPTSAPTPGAMDEEEHQQEPRGEPAALPIHSSLQLDGFFLLVFLNTIFPGGMGVSRPTSGPIMVLAANAERPPCHQRRIKRSTRSLRRAGLLQCPNHSCRLRSSMPFLASAT